jgi:hypothetical protein
MSSTGPVLGKESAKRCPIDGGFLYLSELVSATEWIWKCSSAGCTRSEPEDRQQLRNTCKPIFMETLQVPGLMYETAKDKRKAS